MPAPTRLFDLACQPDPVIAAEPIGTVLRASIGGQGAATASYDETEHYRYRLSRVWDPALRRCLFVMLNPSTATEESLDPTVTRVHRFCLAWGFGSFEVVNIHALRSTKPQVLYQDPDPTGPGNDRAILAAAQAADRVVCAWGVHGRYRNRGEEVLAILDGAGVAMSALGLTKGGHPRHPLYLPRTVWPESLHGPRPD